VSTTIRVETADDHDALDRVVTEAFGTPAEAHLVRQIRAADDHRADLSSVAEVDGVVVGHVMIREAQVLPLAAFGNAATGRLVLPAFFDEFD
jgi:predicted N-acetyltransferase YhbS